MIKVFVAVAFALFVAAIALTVGTASAATARVATVHVTVAADGGSCSDCHGFGGNG